MAERATEPQAVAEGEEGGEEERLKRLRDDALLARKLSIQEEQEADKDYNQARRE